MNQTYQNPLWSQTRIQSSLDFTSPGKRFGDLRLKHSDNHTALGYIPIPAGVIVNNTGPTVLLTGGVHGDEFEGPISLLKLMHEINLDDVHGRIIVLPALNSPALNASARVSPLDDVNLNRAFPGNPDGTPTQMIADFVQSALMPVCDAAIDIHSGGKAYWFSPCAMATYDEDAGLMKTNLELSEVFDCPLIWLMGESNDDRSVNSAAFRNRIPMISVELGGGGHVTPETLQYGERGVRNCLQYLNVLPGKPQPRSEPATHFRIVDPAQHVYTKYRGLFEPAFAPGDVVAEGDPVGYIHQIDQIELPPVRVDFPVSGIAFVRCQRGLVERGELLALVGVESN